MDSTLALTVIASQFPSLTFATIRYLGEGWDSTAFEVNGDLVFRFPKRAEVNEQLLIETRMLDALRAAGAPLPIPAFTYRGTPSAAYPFHFAGYRKLPGVEAILIDPANLPFDAFSAPLGRFLGWLHAFPLDEARRHGARERGGTHVVAEFRTEALEGLDHVSSAATPEELGSWRELLTSVTPSSLGRADHPVVLHSDFYQEHILLDPVSRVLTGIIDWGDVELGDPAFDIAGVFSWGGATFARAVLAHYGRPFDEQLFDRARFVSACRSVVDLKHGLEHGQPEYIAAGRRGLMLALEADAGR